VLGELEVQDVVHLLSTCVTVGVREHCPASHDVPTLLSTRCQDLSEGLTPPQIDIIAAVFRKLQIQDVPLMRALSLRSIEILASDRRGGARAAAGVIATCSKLNVDPGEDLLERMVAGVLPTVSFGDIQRLALLMQVLSKFDLEENQVFADVLAKAQRMLGAAGAKSKARPWLVGVGQMLLPLVFDPGLHRDTKDKLLIAALQKIRQFHLTLGDDYDGLDEQLVRQLQICELAMRIERPMAWIAAQEEGLTPWLNMIRQAKVEALDLAKATSEQHQQVAGILEYLRDHDLEVVIGPYITDIRVHRSRTLIEVDGPLHFINRDTERYSATSRLKHRLLRKMGWRLVNLQWRDWPAMRHSRVGAVQALLHL